MGNCVQSHALTAHRPHPHNGFMAGVWGEASPQAPPEARWTAGRSGDPTEWGVDS